MTTNKRGFTLIELMIVTAIMGILLAIAIPKFQELNWRAKNRERAKEGLSALPMPGNLQRMREPDNKCSGDVVAVAQKEGMIVKVFKNGCEERSY